MSSESFPQNLSESQLSSEESLPDYLQKGIEDGKKWLALKVKVEGGLLSSGGLEQNLRIMKAGGSITEDEAAEIKRLFATQPEKVSQGEKEDPRSLQKPSVSSEPLGDEQENSLETYSQDGYGDLIKLVVEDTERAGGEIFKERLLHPEDGNELKQTLKEARAAGYITDDAEARDILRAKDPNITWEDDKGAVLQEEPVLGQLFTDFLNNSSDFIQSEEDKRIYKNFKEAVSTADSFEEALAIIRNTHFSDQTEQGVWVSRLCKSVGRAVPEEEWGSSEPQAFQKEPEANTSDESINDIEAIVKEVVNAESLAGEKRREEILQVESEPKSEVNGGIILEEKEKKAKGEGIKNGPENIEASLAAARDAYKAEYIKWKNERRAKKNFVSKRLSDFGVEKQDTRIMRSEELNAAEDIYIRAKKESNADLFKEIEKVDQELSMDPANEENFRRYVDLKSSLFEKQKAEYEILQKEIEGARPPLEKSILRKAVDLWVAQPRWARIAISSTVMTVGLFALGHVSFGGALTYGAVRAGKSWASGVLGSAAAQGTSKILNKVSESVDKSQLAKVQSKYVLSTNSFEENEKNLTRLLDKENNRKKRDRIMKAVTMAAAGGAVSLVSAGVLHGSDFTGRGGGASEHIDKITSQKSSGNTMETLSETQKPPANVTEIFSDTPKPSAGSVEQVVDAPKPSINIIENTPDAPKASDLIEVKTELSEGGFIQDIQNLKQKLVEQYGEGKVPAQYDHIMKTPSIKLAQELGFYDAEKNLSGVGLEGESLKIDSNGTLMYHKLDGTEHGMMHADTGELEEKFNGTMKEYGASKETVLNESLPEETQTPEPPVIPDDTLEKLQQNQYQYGEDADLSQGSPVSQEGDVQESPVERESPHPYLDMLKNRGDTKVLTLGDPNGTEVEIAHEQVSGSQRLLALNDKFQDGKQYADIRKFFTSTLNEYIGDRRLGRNVVPVPFEGGTIHVVSGLSGNISGVEVFLNGKEIGNGVLDAGGAKVEILKNLKGGWFLADTVYERAFKEAQKVIKTLKVN
jgi:hypothetical protein